MNKVCTFDVQFESSGADFGDLKFDVLNVGFKAEIDSLQIVKISELPPYEGSYTVDALVKAPVVLPTKGKNLTDDITVKKIRQLEVGNTAGGNTLIIGEDL